MRRVSNYHPLAMTRNWDNRVFLRNIYTKANQFKKNHYIVSKKKTLFKHLEIIFIGRNPHIFSKKN